MAETSAIREINHDPACLRRILTIGALLLTLTGCAQPQVRILWPPPPLVPQFEFVGSYRSQLDLAKQNSYKDLSSIKDTTFFVAPYGIAVDSSGRVVISDIAQKNLRRFDFSTATVLFIKDVGRFSLPSDLFFDSEDQLYILDGKKGLVTILNADLSRKSSFTTRDVLVRPVSLTVNSGLGRIYISDGDGHRIAVFSTAGEHLFSFGKPGNGNGQFNSPQGIAIDNAGRLFIADMLNARIQVFDPEGNYLYKFGQRGDNLWNFTWPKDLAFDSKGNLYVLDQRKAIVTMRRPNGDPILALGEAPTRHNLGFASPVGITIDHNDRLYISDRLNRRFSAWQILTDDYLRSKPITEKDNRRLNDYLEKLAQQRSAR